MKYKKRHPLPFNKLTAKVPPFTAVFPIGKKGNCLGNLGQSWAFWIGKMVGEHKQLRWSIKNSSSEATRNSCTWGVRFLMFGEALGRIFNIARIWIAGWWTKVSQKTIWISMEKTDFPTLNHDRCFIPMQANEPLRKSEKHSHSQRMTDPWINSTSFSLVASHLFATLWVDGPVLHVHDHRKGQDPQANSLWMVRSC